MTTEQQKPLLIGKSSYISAHFADLWKNAKADIQTVIDLYNKTGLPALNNDDLASLFDNTLPLMYDKITGGGHTNLSTSGGTLLPIDKEHAMNIIKKPAGYNELIEGIKGYAGTGHKFYSNTITKVGFDLKDITRYFLLNEDGCLEYTAYQLNEIEEAGNQYVKTEKGRDTYHFVNDIAAAFFNNNMDKHLHLINKCSTDNLFSLLNDVLKEIDYSTKQAVHIHINLNGYAGDRKK